MGFYERDRTNDPLRRVERYSRSSLGEFWASGDGGQNFLITGGSEASRAYVLSGAVERYLQSKRAPVILFHNDPRTAATITSNLQNSLPAARVTVFGAQRRTYLLLSEMSKGEMLECLRGQIALSHYTDRMGIELCAASYLNLLERYNQRMSLTSLRELSRATNETLVAMARAVELPQNEINNITGNAAAAAGLREILRQLEESARRISDGTGRGQSISGCVKRFASQQVILVETGGGDTRRLTTCLADEIRLLLREHPQMLLVVDDILMRQEDTLLELARSAAVGGRLSLGICSETLEAMLPEETVYNSVRAMLKKKVLMKYRDGAAAGKLREVFGTYEHITRTVVTAPTKPWTIIKPKAPGMAKEMRPRIEDLELTEMGEGSAILYGHRGDSIVFCRQLVR